jgi:iron complex transport system permease protein
MLSVLIALLIVLVVASLALGSVSVPLPEVVRTLLGQEVERRWSTIVLDLRLPRMATAILAGAAMALAGLSMQTLFRNALAEPYVLGVTAGASLAVGLVILPQGAGIGFGAALSGLFEGASLVGASALGALVVLLVMAAVAARVESLTVVLIAGVLVGFFLMAIVNVLVYFARPESVVSFNAWQFGTFARVRLDQIPLFGTLVLGGLMLVSAITKQLNAYLLGEQYAQSMGMSIRRFRMTAMVATAILAGTVTAFAGPIAFLGIAAPHLARGLFDTTDHRLLVPWSALVGACIALAAGLFAQLPGSTLVLPLNAALALIGAPVLMHVLLRINRTGRGFNV